MKQYVKKICELEIDVDKSSTLFISIILYGLTDLPVDINIGLQWIKNKNAIINHQDSIIRIDRHLTEIETLNGIASNAGRMKLLNLLIKLILR